MKKALFLSLLTLVATSSAFAANHGDRCGTASSFASGGNKNPDTLPGINYFALTCLPDHEAGVTFEFKSCLYDRGVMQISALMRRHNVDVGVVPINLDVGSEDYNQNTHQTTFRGTYGAQPDQTLGCTGAI